jgi:hypothetical protein
VFGKQIHHFEVVLVIRLFGETVLEGLAWTSQKRISLGRVACPTGALPQLEVREVTTLQSMQNDEGAKRTVMSSQTPASLAARMALVDTCPRRLCKSSTVTSLKFECAAHGPQ